VILEEEPYDDDKGVKRGRRDRSKCEYVEWEKNNMGWVVDRKEGRTLTGM